MGDRENMRQTKAKRVWNKVFHTFKVGDRVKIHISNPSLPVFKQTNGQIGKIREVFYRIDYPYLVSFEDGILQVFREEELEYVED